MIRISYSSKLLPEYNKYDTIQNINLISLKNNTKNNINGELFWNYETGNIIQIIEGEINNINRLFQKIKNDHRHTDCKLMECNEITEFIYTKWECNIAQQSKKIITFNDFIPISFLGFSYDFQPNLDPTPIWGYTSPRKRTVEDLFPSFD